MIIFSFINREYVKLYRFIISKKIRISCSNLNSDSLTKLHHTFTFSDLTCLLAVVNILYEGLTTLFLDFLFFSCCNSHAQDPPPTMSRRWKNIWVSFSFSSHFPWKCFTVYFSHRYIKMYMRTEHTWEALSELWTASYIQYLCLLLDSFWRTVYIGIERMSSMLHVSQHWMHLKHWWDDLNSGCLVLQELASA